MSTATPEQAAEAALSPPAGRPWRARRRWAAAGVVVVVVAAGVVAAVVTGGSGWPSHPSSGLSGNTHPAATATVTRRSLSSQTQVNATLGYAGSYSVVNQAQGTITALPCGRPGGAAGPGAVPGERQPRRPALRLQSRPTATCRKATDRADVAELNADLVALGYATSAELDRRSDYFSCGDRVRAGEAAGRSGRRPDRHPGTGPGRVPAHGGAGHRVQATAGRPGPARPAGADGDLDHPRGHDRPGRRPAGRGQGRRQGHHHPARQQTTPGRGVLGGHRRHGPPSQLGSARAARSRPTITVEVTPTDPAATGSLDQAPVEVSITTASVKDALVVPVDALLALASGGYAVEVVGAAGAHHLVPVSLGPLRRRRRAGPGERVGPGRRPARRGARAMSARHTAHGLP